MVEATTIGSSFSDRLMRVLERVDYRRVEPWETGHEVFRLRHEAYLREGNIDGEPEGHLRDAFDEAGNCWTFALYLDGDLAASLRIGLASTRHGSSPAVRFFPDLLEPEIQAGRVIVDPNRLVTAHRVARTTPELAYLTVRLGYVAEQHFGADMVTATVRAEHQAFYRRVFNLRAECLPRFVPPIRKPFCLMTSRGASAAAIMRRYPCFQSTEAERLALFGPPGEVRPAPVRPSLPEPSAVH